MDLDRDSSPAPLTRRGLLERLAAFTLAVFGGAQAARARQAKRAVAWDGKMEMALDFEIIQPDGMRYHRPYVAVWLEDRNGKAVRTLSLWVENSGRGPRWIPDLRRWYRDFQDEQTAGGPDLLATISSATRIPGKYSLIWDGKDDLGKPAPQGTYTLNLETAREHGPYGLLQKELTIGPAPFKVEIVGNADIKGAAIEYRKRA